MVRSENLTHEGLAKTAHTQVDRVGLLEHLDSHTLFAVAAMEQVRPN